jgi:hypothetical protein
MRKWAIFGVPALIVLVFILVLLVTKRHKTPAPAAAAPAYLGFDRNDYPGDDKLPALKKTFSYAGYWLNVPPNDPNGNLWAGKRESLQKMGFGFLLLFNGRTYKQLQASGSAADAGKKDAQAAVDSARHEGFPPNAVIYLDVEEGGRLLREQREYVLAWVDGVASSGFRPGVYCSGIRVPEGTGKSISTADDLREQAKDRQLSFWVSNDVCGPSPGCVFPAEPPLPVSSGIGFASVWQYVQSPRRKQYTAACANTYASDGRCFPPGLKDADIDVDVSTADSSDPSGGRKRGPIPVWDCKLPQFHCDSRAAVSKCARLP